jgi:RNA polymerase primary sigma factor
MRQLVIEERATMRTVSLNRYFADVGPSNILTPDEEYELAVKCAAGDEEAISRLVKCNLRFVISVAKQYSRDGESLSELISQGNIGLLEAARKFDPTKGFRFISFAVWHIRKEILLYFNKYTRAVRLPQSIILNISRVKKVDAQLAVKLDREATPEEVVEEMKKNGWDITPDNVVMTRLYETGGSIALEPTDPDEEWAPINWLDSGEDPFSQVEANDSVNYIKEALKTVSDFEKDLIDMKLGLFNNDPHSYTMIGTKYKKSSEWARQNYEKAIKKVKKNMKKMNISKGYHEV